MLSLAGREEFGRYGKGHDAAQAHRDRVALAFEYRGLEGFANGKRGGDEAALAGGCRIVINETIGSASDDRGVGIGIAMEEGLGVAFPGEIEQRIGAHGLV